jgi:2-phospho-L-lactate guanylyltransferase
VTWVIVLVKDFDTAKQRLSPALEPAARRALAMANAERAIRAAAEVGHVLVVAGSEEAAGLARRLGAEILLEAEPRGQNPAAAAGIAHALRRGADAVLVLSSDLPLVTAASLRRVLGAAAPRGPAAVAAAATGRGGTNALFLRPPDALGLHFGDRSLPKFEADAAARGVDFQVLEDPALALDLDEPADLAALGAR